MRCYPEIRNQKVNNAKKFFTSRDMKNYDRGRGTYIYIYISFGRHKNRDEKNLVEQKNFS